MRRSRRGGRKRLRSELPTEEETHRRPEPCDLFRRHGMRTRNSIKYNMGSSVDWHSVVIETELNHPLVREGEARSYPYDGFAGYKRYCPEPNIPYFCGSLRYSLDKHHRWEFLRHKILYERMRAKLMSEPRREMLSLKDACIRTLRSAIAWPPQHQHAPVCAPWRQSWERIRQLPQEVLEELLLGESMDTWAAYNALGPHAPAMVVEQNMEVVYDSAEVSDFARRPSVLYWIELRYDHRRGPLFRKQRGRHESDRYDRPNRSRKRTKPRAKETHEEVRRGLEDYGAC